MTRDGVGHGEALAATMQSDSAQSSSAPTAGEWPTTIGKFEVERKLGEGGMGVVLLATDPALGRRVALKLLRAGAEANVEGRARFFREAQVMARLTHENIVVVHEVGEHDGRAYVAMEYVEGGTLAGWPADKSWRAIVEIYIRAGRGLEAAHKAGLVHRDFKPDNVLVGNDGRVRVSDFGLAGFDLAVPATGATTPASDMSTGLTRTGALMGTPRYMAPEQHLGQPLDARADQFAFCVAPHEALYGTGPFPGTTYAQIVAAVTSGHPISPPQTSDVPEAVRDAVLRGIARDPDARFPSMSELLAILGSALAQRAPRPRWLIPAVGVGVAGAVLGGVLAVRDRTSSSADPVDVTIEKTEAMEKSTARVDDGEADQRPRLIIGSFGGDGMTNGIRGSARPAIASMLAKLAPDLHVTLEARPSDDREAARGRAVQLEIELAELDVGTKNELTCKVTAIVATYPDKVLLARASANGKAVMQSRALKDLDASGADCVDAVTEGLMATQILPFVRRKLEAASAPATRP